MDWVSHFSAGFLAGAAILPLDRRFPRQVSLRVPTLVGVGSLLPDLDGVTVFFAHDVYYGRGWISHRGALHSPVGMIPVALLISVAVFHASRHRIRNERAFPLKATFGCLYVGSLLHMLADLPTPPGSWNGLMPLWPLSSVRWGGFSRIFWANEYLIVLLSLSAVATLGLLLLLRRAVGRWLRVATSLMLAVSLISLLETCRFVLQSEFTSRSQWEDYQKCILGEDVYGTVHHLQTLSESIWERELL